MNGRGKLLFVSISAIVGILLFAVFSMKEQGIFSTSGTGTRDDILRLARIFDYGKIVELGERDNWKNAEDPEILMTYCRAIVETGKSLPNAFRAPRIPKNVALFAEAYLDLLKGHVNRAEARFVSLTKSDQHKTWGYLGTLEQSLITQDYVAMGNVLKEWQALSIDNHTMNWITPYYQVRYLSGIGRHEELARVLAEPELLQRLRPGYIAPFKAALLLRENRFSEAHAVLDASLAAVGFDVGLVLAKVSVISAEQGLSGASDYLQKIQRQIPRAWPIEIHRVLHETEGNRISSSEAAGALIAVVKRRPFDAETVVNVSPILFDLGDHAASIELLETLPTSLDDKLRFANYYLLMAKFDQREGTKHSLRNNLQRALEMHPADTQILWFKYSVSRREKNHVKAIETLNVLLQLDPNDRPALLAMTRVNEDMKQWDEVLQAGERFLGSKRVISVKAEEEVRNRMQRASKETDDKRGRS
jgi:tetratricopeptide (TPR) repeat protein